MTFLWIYGGWCGGEGVRECCESCDHSSMLIVLFTFYCSTPPNPFSYLFSVSLYPVSSVFLSPKTPPHTHHLPPHCSCLCSFVLLRDIMPLGFSLVWFYLSVVYSSLSAFTMLCALKWMFKGLQGFKPIILRSAFPNWQQVLVWSSHSFGLCIKVLCSNFIVWSIFFNPFYVVGQLLFR